MLLHVNLTIMIHKLYAILCLDNDEDEEVECENTIQGVLCGKWLDMELNHSQKDCMRSYWEGEAVGITWPIIVAIKSAEE